MEKPSKSSLTEFWNELGPGIIASYILGLAAYGWCLFIACNMRPLDEWWLNVLLCLFGGALGWFVGTLVSPMTGVEESKFTKYTKAISTFVSGFVAAKLDSLLTRLNLGDHPDTALLIGRVLLFATTFILILQFPFIARLQVLKSKAAQEKTKEVHPKQT